MSDPEITSVRTGESPDGAFTASSRPAALAPGARVGNFTVVRVLGVGGFGIVYLAEQELTGRQVALKEFFPSSMLDRADSHAVRLRSGKDEELFAMGMRCFVKEATLLSELSHPGLVQVLHFWEENGTAYMVMPFYDGIPLSQLLPTLKREDMPGLISRLLDGLLPALEYLHQRQIYHRDISPDNIFMLSDGRPMLLDFGAARRIVDRQEAVTVILKTGYAPIEQYDGGGRQGAWTDIYALSALLYKLVTGHAPQAAAARACEDQLRPLACAGHDPAFPDSLLKAIDAGLALRPEDRPASVAAWRRILDTPDGQALPEPEDAVVTFHALPARRRLRTGWLLVLLVAAAALAWLQFRPEGRQRQVVMEARQLYGELDKVLPTLEKHRGESEARVRYYREKLGQARDAAERAGIRESLYTAEEDAFVTRVSLDAYGVKLKKELPLARRRLAMADAARDNGKAEEAGELYQSVWLHLQGLKEWSDGQVKASALRRKELVQSLNGVWGGKACGRDVETWMLAGDTLHITREAADEVLRVVAAYDGKVITAPPLARDQAQRDEFREVRVMAGTLQLQQAGRKQTLRPCDPS